MERFAMLRAFVINLDRSSDRLARMSAEFARVGMAFERFPAVYGTDLPDSLKPYFCDAAGRVATPLRPGEIGTYASHLGVWQRIVRERVPVALVCEDDIFLPDDLPGLIGQLLATLPAGWDVVRLSSKARRAIVPVTRLAAGRLLLQYTRSPLLAGATLVSQAGAAKLLKPGIRREATDGDLARPWKFDLNEYGVLPTPVRQDASTSIAESMGGRSYRRRRFARWFSPDRPRRLAHNIRKLGFRRWLLCCQSPNLAQT
jgi:glycosyl transferase family 25